MRKRSLRNGRSDDPEAKMRINHKRLKPYLSKDELYPEEYDFDIIFESKDTRKKRKLMQRKHVEGLRITHKDEE